MLRERDTPGPFDIPLVSICIPAYRADKYLEQCLRSVAAQTFSDWEVVVTEDGSRDRAEEIVRSFAASVRQPVVYNRHEKNRGLSATRNTGIEVARGTWIAWLDADDLWRAEHLEALVATARQVSCEMVFSGTEWFEDQTGRTVLKSVPTRGDIAELPVALYTGRLSILPSSAMVRRQCFERYGVVSEEFPHTNDTEYWLRLLRSGGRAAYSGQVTCLYRKHASAMSRRAADMLAESARICERYADWDAIPRHLKRQRPANLYRWAARTLLREDPARARRIVANAVRLQPLSLKNLGIWAKATFQRPRPGPCEAKAA